MNNSGFIDNGKNNNLQLKSLVLAKLTFSSTDSYNTFFNCKTLKESQLNFKLQTNYMSYDISLIKLILFSSWHKKNNNL